MSSIRNEQLVNGGAAGFSSLLSRSSELSRVICRVPGFLEILRSLCMFTRNPSKRWSRPLMLAFGVVLFCTMLSSGASAQSWNKRTSVTFSAPVEIPGKDAQVLPAGKDVFQLLH